MGIRQKINEKPTIAAIAVAVPLVTAGYLFVQSFAGQSTVVHEPVKVFFSSDDGATYFAGPITNHPPFSHNGAEAVRAFVFDCGGNASSPKVAFLMKYTPEGRQRLEAAQANPDGDYTDAIDGMPRGMILYKRPGGSAWVPGDSPKVDDIRLPDCPPGAVGKANLPPN